MANKYDIRGQYETQRAERDAHKVSEALGTALDFAGFALDIAETGYDLYKQDQEGRAKEDFDNAEEDIIGKLYDFDYEYDEKPFISNDGDKYTLENGDTYSLQNGDKVEGSTIFSRRVADKTDAFNKKKEFLDGYLESGVLDGKSEAYKNAYKEYFNTFKNNTKLTLFENLQINLAQDNQNRALNNAKSVLSSMGSANSDRYAQDLQYILGKDYTGAKYEIPEVTANLEDEEYANQSAQRDFAIQRNLLYEYYRGAYSEEEATQLMEDNYVAQAWTFNYNDATDNIDNFIKKNPYVDTNAYAETLVNSFTDTSKNPLFNGKDVVISQAQKEEMQKEISSLITQRKQVLSGQISETVTKKLNELYDQNLVGEKFTTAVLNNMYNELGITQDVAYTYMDSDTLKALKTYESIASQNENYITAKTAVNTLNLSDDDILSQCQKEGTELYGISVETAQEARIAYFNKLPTSVQSYIYDNPYTTEKEYILIKPTEKETSSGYILTNEEFSNVLTAEKQLEKDTETAKSEYYYPRWEYGTMSLETYDTLGITDEYFEERKKAYEKEIGTEVTDDAYATILRDEVNTIYEKQLGKSATSKRVTEHTQQVQKAFSENIESSTYDIYMWENGYGFNTSNGVFNSAIDELYKEYGGTDEKATYLEKCAYLESHTVIDPTISDPIINTGKEIKAVAVKSERTKSLASEILEKGNELVAEKKETLLLMKGTDETLYNSSVTSAEKQIKETLNKIETEQTKAQEDAVAYASTLISTGSTPTEAKAILLGSGVSSDVAQNAVLTAQGKIYDKNTGKLSINLEGFSDAFGDTSYIEVQYQLNQWLDDLTNKEDVFTANAIKENMINQLMPVIYTELQKDNPNVDKAITNFMAQNENVALKAWKSIAKDITSISDVSSLGKSNGYEYKANDLDLSKLSFAQDYSEGKAYMMTYSQLIEDGTKLEGNNQIYSLLINDTSLSDDKVQGYALVYAMNAVFGTDIYSVDEVANMALKDIKNSVVGRCLSTSPSLFGQVTAVASILYGGRQATKKLVDMNENYDWIDLSSGTNQKITFTPVGNVIECQTLYGNSVYAIPKFKNNKCVGFNFYEDENCTQPIISGWQYATSSPSYDQVESTNIATLLTYDTYIKAYTGQQIEGGDKKYLYTTATGQQKTDALGNIIGYSNNDVYSKPIFNSEGLSTNSEGIPESVQSIIKENWINYQKTSAWEQTTYTPIVNIDIADGTMKVSKYDVDTNKLTKNGNIYTNNKGQQFEMSETGLVPKLTTPISNENATRYFFLAQELVSRSNNTISFKDAYSAVLYCYEGYDKPCLYVDSNGKGTMYYPKMYEYIAKNYVDTTDVNITEGWSNNGRAEDYIFTTKTAE